MDNTLRELEREALLLAFGKGGSWKRYWYLKDKADAELAAFIASYEKKKFFRKPGQKIIKVLLVSPLIV